MAAVVLIIAWAITGPVFHYSDTWQLIINTSTTIVTFLMVFLLKNTQNRDTAAIQLKLDELIRANEDARNKMLCLEDLSEDELKKVKATFVSLAAAPAAAGQIRETSERLEDAGEAFHGAAAELGPVPTVPTPAAIWEQGQPETGPLPACDRQNGRVLQVLVIARNNCSGQFRRPPPRRSQAKSAAYGPRFSL